MSFLQGLSGPPNVDKLVAERNIRGLIKALRYRKDSSIREGAALELGELKAAQAVEPLCAALRDKVVMCANWPPVRWEKSPTRAP